MMKTPYRTAHQIALLIFLTLSHLPTSAEPRSPTINSKIFGSTRSIQNETTGKFGQADPAASEGTYQRVADTRDRSSRSSDLVETTIDPLPPESGYVDVTDAVIDAANRHNPDSITYNREHVGGILVCTDGQILFTHGVGEPNQAPVPFSVPQSSKCRLEALWHTHGARGDFKSMFSAADTHSSNRIGRPIYMADHKGALRVFEPGAKTSGRQRRNRKSIVRLDKGVAAGKIVRDQSGDPVKIRTKYSK